MTTMGSDDDATTTPPGSLTGEEMANFREIRDRIQHDEFSPLDVGDVFDLADAFDRLLASHKALAARNAALAAQGEAMRGVLGRLEWSDMIDGQDSCPMCGGLCESDAEYDGRAGHRRHCQLASALDGPGGAKGGEG